MPADYAAGLYATNLFLSIMFIVELVLKVRRCSLQPVFASTE